MEFELTFRTQRLILRPWREADLAPFAALNADPRVREFFGKLLTCEESDASARRIMQLMTEHPFGLWAVEVPGVADFIGFTGLNAVTFEAPFTPCVEIGWRLAYEFWGRGYASEAAEAAVRYAFETLKLPEIVAFVVPTNARSRAVMARLGMHFSHADDFEHPSEPAGHPLRPHLLYRLRHEEYLARGRFIPLQVSGFC